MTSQVRKVIFASVIAAAYAALTLIAWPLAFAEFQFRLSEFMAILPYFFPIAVPGLFVGCIISNILSPYGLADMIVGSAATLCASLITMHIGKSKRSGKIAYKAVACLPPVIINALFIGVLIAYFMAGSGQPDVFWPAFALNALQIGFGQAVIIYLIGLPLMIYLPKTGAVERLKQIYE